MNNMLSRLMGKKDAEIQAIVANVDAAAAPRGLRRKFEKIRSKKQGGFTLLELLVVVAILAAIAGTATIMLHDTDKKAFAAAHVAMMDELSKGILSFQQLNAGKYPNAWDSLMSNATGVLDATATPSILLNEGLADNLAQHVLSTDEFDALKAVGITELRVLNEAATGIPDQGTLTCANTEAGIRALINSKANNVTSQNIYRSPASNGCGNAATIADGNALLAWDQAQNERVNAKATDVLIAFGVGPDSTLFQSANYGALTNTPIYRHVEGNEYNRFVALFNVTSDSTKPTNGKATFQAIVDGAGDTKDEELGEFDNVRPT